MESIFHMIICLNELMSDARLGLKIEIQSIQGMTKIMHNL